MDSVMLEAAWDALVIMSSPYRLMMLTAGVLMGLVLGIIPGIGGLVGMVLVLPFTFTLDPYTAFAVLLGLSAVTGTSDTIPAVMFGVPGTAGAQATVMDGNPMAKNGEAGRALSAAFTASMIGGLFGAALLALSIPAIRPLILYIGSPELLAMSLFGISLVAVLSGRAPLRGLVAACLGIMLAMIGADPQSGTMRWTYGGTYMWDGLPLVSVALGLFALPELADMAIRRMSISDDGRTKPHGGTMRGIRDALSNWWLVIRCGALGAGIGAIPGLGSSVVDWIAYAHAKQSVKGASETFGKGDVRGVLAPESANNSITAGALVPTIAFGVPGSASMAILLGAFMIHGLAPGPEMLTRHLNVTYSMVWSVAIANVIGAGICLAFAAQLARIATLRFTVIVPVVVIVVIVGAFQATRQWGDLYALLFFFVLGWTMKRLRWPRPPLILGFVLGGIIERYLFISSMLYGASWLLRPVVAALLGLALLSMLAPLVTQTRARGGVRATMARFRTVTLRTSDLYYVVLIGLIGFMLWEATAWSVDARLGPMVVGGFALIAAATSLVFQIFMRTPEDADNGLHMDVVSDPDGMTTRQTLLRAGGFLLYLLGFMASMATIGMIPTIPLFIALYMRIEGPERWPVVALNALLATLFVYGVFDQLLNILWPQTLLGQWVPALRWIPSV